MEVYTVSLFGHKEFNNPLKVGKQLEKEVRDLIDRNEYVEFLIGRNGMFDLFAASVIREVCKEYTVRSQVELFIFGANPGRKTAIFDAVSRPKLVGNILSLLVYWVAEIAVFFQCRKRSK